MPCLSVSRRRLLAAATLPLLVVGSRVAHACDGRRVFLVVPYPAGGSLDAVMRVVAEQASRGAGRPFIIVNAPGASGAVAVRQVLRADADGCTVLAGTFSEVVLAPLLAPAAHAPEQLVPVGKIGTTEMLLVSSPSLPVDDVADLHAYADRLQRQVTAGHPGDSTVQRIALGVLEERLGLTMNAIPYRGSAPLMNDVLGRHVDLGVVARPVAQPLVERGELKVVANLTQWLRAPGSRERGELDGWTGWFVEESTPAVARRWLRQVLLEALATPAVQSRLRQLGTMVPTAEDQDRFDDTVALDIQRMRKRFERAKAR